MKSDQLVHQLCSQKNVSKLRVTVKVEIQKKVFKATILGNKDFSFSIFYLFPNLRGILVLWDIFILHSYCFGFTNFSRCLFLYVTTCTFRSLGIGTSSYCFGFTNFSRCLSLLQLTTVQNCNKKIYLEEFVKQSSINEG